MLLEKPMEIDRIESLLKKGYSVYFKSGFGGHVMLVLRRSHDGTPYESERRFKFGRGVNVFQAEVSRALKEMEKEIEMGIGL
jgi:hypothetical protein